MVHLTVPKSGPALRATLTRADGSEAHATWDQTAQVAVGAADADAVEEQVFLSSCAHAFKSGFCVVLCTCLQERVLCCLVHMSVNAGFV